MAGSDAMKGLRAGIDDHLDLRVTSAQF